MEKNNKENNLKERDVKELELDVNKSDKKDEKSNSGSDNSFYDRQEEKNSSSGWKSKALGVTLATLIFIGAGIPAGMASTGYFANYKGPNSWDLIEEEINNWNPDASILNDINNAKSSATVWYFEQMSDQGFFAKGEYDKDVETTNDKVDQTISDEKDSYKDSYGDVWEVEWTNHLSDQGFDSEEEYKNSLIASNYRTIEVNKLISKQNFIIKTTTDPSTLGAKYYSDINSSGFYRYINNDVPVNIDSDPENDKAFDFAITPEDLVDLYLTLYQPVLFNDSSISFIPTSGAESTESSLDPDFISMTTDQIWNSIGYFNMLSGSTYEPGVDHVSAGIQSKSSLTSSSEDQYPVYALYLSQTSSTAGIGGSVDIAGMINGALSAGGVSPTSSHSEINKMSSDDIDAFESSLFESMKSNGLIDSSDDGSTRNFTTVYDSPISTYDDGSDVGKLVTFVTSTGLHTVGVAREGEELIIDYLNVDNRVPGYEHIIESSVDSNLNSWVSSNFDNILLNVWLQQEDYSSIVDLEDNIDMFLEVFYGGFAINKKENVMSIFEEADAYFQTNWKTFDYNNVWLDGLKHDFFETVLNISPYMEWYDTWYDSGTHEIFDILNLA